MKYLLLILALLFSLPAYAEQERGIFVNGIGEVEVPVDNVIIHLGVNTRNKDIEKAKAENQNKYAKILEIITTKYKLGKDAIKSNFVSINPSYVPCYATPDRPTPKCDQAKIDFYEVSRNLEIKLNDLEKYDALIGDLSQNANYVNTGQYDVTNKTKYKDEARDLAIDSAKSKAEKIASKLQVKLGKPLRFDTVDDEVNRPQPMQLMAKMANAEVAGDGAAPTDTATMGKIKISVSVNIAYQIE